MTRWVVSLLSLFLFLLLLCGPAISWAETVDAEYSLQSKTVRAARGWDEVLRYDFPLLTLKSPAVLDFGAAGKGYLIDIVSEILHTEGVKHFCVDAGGDMFYSHPENKLLEVALENPNDTSEAIGIATIANESICGSAGNLCM
jgi:thiamine biosynthesis lipoprotein